MQIINPSRKKKWVFKPVKKKQQQKHWLLRVDQINKEMKREGLCQHSNKKRLFSLKLKMYYRFVLSVLYLSIGIRLEVKRRPIPEQTSFSCEGWSAVINAKRYFLTSHNRVNNLASLSEKMSLIMRKIHRFRFIPRLRSPIRAFALYGYFSYNTIQYNTNSSIASGHMKVIHFNVSKDTVSGPRRP